MALIDLTGKRFGKWLVLERVSPPGKPLFWSCRCDCGTVKLVGGQMLRIGESKSCGCIKQRHGDNYVPFSSIWYKRAAGIARKCRNENIPYGFISNCELATHLMSIAPERCPVFGFPLTDRTRGAFSPQAPSVDRIIPHLGYVRGNIQVISQKANTMKHDASQADLERFAEWIVRSSTPRLRNVA